MKRIFIFTLLFLVTGAVGYFLGSSRALIDSPSDHTLLDQISPQHHSTTVKIQIIPKDSINQTSTGQDSQQSRETMINSMIKNLDLEKRYKADKSQLHKMLTEILEASNPEDFTINVDIPTKSENQAEEIAQAIADAYETIRKKRRAKMLKKLQQHFTQKIKEQEQQVEKNRKKLEDLSKKLGIPYHK